MLKTNRTELDGRKISTSIYGNMASARGPQKVPWRIQNNPKDSLVKQITSDTKYNHL